MTHRRRNDHDCEYKIDSKEDAVVHETIFDKGAEKMACGVYASLRDALVEGERNDEGVEDERKPRRERGPEGAQSDKCG